MYPMTTGECHYQFFKKEKQGKHNAKCSTKLSHYITANSHDLQKPLWEWAMRAEHLRSFTQELNLEWPVFPPGAFRLINEQG